MLWRSTCLVPESFQRPASSYRCCLCWEVQWGKRRSFTTSTAVTWTLTCSLRCERIWEAGLGLLGFRDGKAGPVSWGGKVGTSLKAGLGAAEEGCGEGSGGAQERGEGSCAGRVEDVVSEDCGRKKPSSPKLFYFFQSILLFRAIF